MVTFCEEKKDVLIFWARDDIMNIQREDITFQEYYVSQFVKINIEN